MARARAFGRAVRSLLFACVAAALGAPSAQAAGGESVDQALCRLIEAAALREALPAAFLTRLIWRESSFRSHVVSSKGAQGIAQFMPGTAAERGLRNPFDPEAALPAAASLLADLQRRFGNLGLAAAAYNAGPARVDAFLAGRSGLPSETRLYVRLITGRSAEDWAAAKRGEKPAPGGPPAGKSGADKRSEADKASEARASSDMATAPETERKTGAARGFSDDGKSDDGKSDYGKSSDGKTGDGKTCLGVVAALRQGEPALAGTAESPDFAPWGVQVAGAFSKSVALAAYSRAANRFAGVIGERSPMVIGTRVPGRGRGPFYRVRLPAQTRAEANALCASLHKAGGACIVLAN
ncbi:lytic transglycosylase domain-containing protein [Xanthobacter sp. VTT E-85241]|uniref:lytic transglycosylase domain-containing protein n=1 Tax=Roseixanthobacter finlandensis TaxID=3119922 RepID=UPI00372B2144